MSRLLRHAVLLSLALPALAVDPKHIDTTVNPCDDFYAYAVGAWQKSSTIPADRARWGAFNELEEANRKLLERIAVASSASLDKPKSESHRKIGAFYKAGMDEATIESLGLKPLADDLAAIANANTPEAVLTALAQLHLYRAPTNWRGPQPAGFAVVVRQDQKDSTRYLLQLAQGGLGLPEREYYLADDAKNKSLREAYITFAARLLELSGTPAERAKTDAEAVLALETRFARSHMNVVERRDPEKTYNKTTQAAFNKEHSAAPWPAYFKALGIAADEPVNIAQPKFFAELSKALADTPVATWQTYLRVRLLSDWADHLPKAYRDAQFAFRGKALQGLQAQPPRERSVMESMDFAIGFALGELFVAEAYSAAAQERMERMIVHIKSAMSNSINSLDWMGEETKQQAIKKLNAIVWKVGAPRKPRDYAGVDIRANQYLASARNAGRYNTGYGLTRLGKPINREEWAMTPQTVNAYYNAGLNEIVFPAGMLQPPFFDVNGDDAGNYGAIGMVIGHELSHGFDDSGRKFDAVGNLRNWWTKDDEERFLKRVEKIQAQYSGYKPLPDLAVNGKLTTGENIADFGGINVAWRAYGLTDEAKAGQSQNGFSPQQRFFLSYAQAWRVTQRAEHLRMQLMTDSHSPPRYRVLGPLANFQPFFDAFNCKGTSAFARSGEDVIRIW